MEPGQSLVRSVRLAQIQHLLHKNPRGLTSRELGKLCGVCIRTVQRDLLALQSDLGIPLTQDGDSYGILDSYILPPISFSLYETMGLLLACRLILRQTDESNPHIEMAFHKLSRVLPPGLSERMLESVRAIGNKPPNSEFIRIFEQVALAWSTQRQLRIQYQALRSLEAREWRLDAYFVEMTGVGYSIYVIGYGRCAEREGLTTFKLDRIKQAELLETSFDIPRGLNLGSLLDSSWGVIWGEESEVKLRFSPQVTRRVKESVWHPSQVIEDLPDGGCLFKVRVGSTLEMTPWIRGWGPDVEVLAPENLRNEFRVWANQFHNMYRE